MKKEKCINKIVSYVLAAIMMISVFTVAAPQQAKAAGDLSFTGKKSTVSIGDVDCSYVTGTPNYISFKSTVNGYVTIKINNNSDATDAEGYITFCNSKKKALGQTREYFDTIGSGDRYYTRTYGVQKGQTYYFQVESIGGVKITATATAVKTNKYLGATRAKAKKALTKNKSVSGYIPAGKNTVHWYKVNLTKKQKLKIAYSAKTNGATVSGDYIYYNNGIKITLCTKNGKPFATGSNNYSLASLRYPSDTTTYYLKNSYTGKESGLDKGTYYIKVERYNKTSSGFYTLKWK